MSPAVHGRSMRPKSWSGMRCCQQLHKVRVFAGKVGWFQVGGDRYIGIPLPDPDSVGMDDG